MCHLLSSAAIGQLATVVVAGLVFGVALYKRNLPRMLYYIWLALCIFIYALGYLFEVTAFALDGALAGLRLQRLALPFISAFYYLFVRDYYNRALRSRVWVVLLLAFPCLNGIVLLSRSLLPYYYVGVDFLTAPFAHTAASPGPLYIATAVFDYLCLGLGLVIIVRNLFRREYRAQSALFCVMSALPGVAFALRLVGMRAGYFDVISATMTLVLLVFGLRLVRYGMADWMPYARDSVLENVNEAFILLDSANRFMDANAKAQLYFPDIKHMSAGRPINKVAGFPTEVLAEGVTTREFTLTRGGRMYDLRASRSDILYNGRRVCNCVMVHDITEISELMRELNELATHDSLTGLYNRGTFLRLAERDFNLAVRGSGPAALMMIDLDSFKQINDRYGHQSGDEVLAGVGEQLQARLRRTDIVGRYGGEEFCVLLPGTGREGAEAIGGLLLRELALQRHHCGGAGLHATVSIGVSVLDPARHKNLEAFIASADEALYRAKAEGRNRMCFG